MRPEHTLLAGDVGGTKTVLCLYHYRQGLLRPQRRATLPSHNHACLEDLLQHFLRVTDRISAVCLGIAGPVTDGAGHITNLNWQTSQTAIAHACNTDAARLYNDMEATAYGMLNLPQRQLTSLNPAADHQRRAGTIAVIAVGTGLGEIILCQDGHRYHAIPGEGGHCDMAPQTARQDALLAWLRERYPDHVSYERILRGDGFLMLYSFLRDSGVAPESARLQAQLASGNVDANALISQHGLAGDDALCTEALALFVDLYGAEAGNLALKSLPRGGLYVGGGVAPKIQAALTNGRFLTAFLRKGRMRSLLTPIPLYLSLNPDTPLIGAVHGAVELLQPR